MTLRSGAGARFDLAGLNADQEAVGVRLKAAATMYLSARRNEFAPKTRREVSYTLAAFVRAVGPELLIARLKRKHIEEWIGHLELAPATIRGRLSVVRTFTAWCVASGHVKVDPCAGIKGPRQPVAMPREIDDPNDLSKLLRAVPDERGELIVLLMLQEGLRRGEVSKLLRERIDLTARVMLVHGKGNKERWLPISDQTFEALTAYLRSFPGATGPLIRSTVHPARGLGPEMISKLVSQWMRDAGIKDHAYDGRSPHALRHTFAGAMLDDGADIRDVQQALGHQSLGPTYIYLRRRQATGRLREVMGQRRYE